jgi:hypothetical protein
LLSASQPDEAVGSDTAVGPDVAEESDVVVGPHVGVMKLVVEDDDELVTEEEGVDEEGGLDHVVEV